MELNDSILIETNNPVETENQDSYIFTITLILVVTLFTIVLNLIRKRFSKKQNPTNTILLVGPSYSGKTAFFYYLLNHSQKETVSSIKINRVENEELPDIQGKKYTVLDVPGQGFFKRDIIDNLNSADKKSITDSAEYFYDILNNDRLNEETPILVVCNKQDLNFAKAKKIIEADLTNEIENIKKIKQNTTLEDNSQYGSLYTLKVKFNFNMFKNIKFVETTKKENYDELRKTIVENLG